MNGSMRNVHRRRIVITIAALAASDVLGCSVRVGCGAQSEKLTGDYAALQGTWIVTHDEEAQVVKSERYGRHLIFEGHEFYFNGESVKQRVVLDEKATPKRIDLTIQQYSFKGIYKLEDDVLTLVTAPNSEPRPTRFESTQEAGTVLTIAQKRR